MSKITLYHYTSKDGAAGIQKKRKISASSGGHSGPGVYFTSLGPNDEEDPKKILINNYDDAGRVLNSKRVWAKIDYVVEINIRRDEVEVVNTSDNRDVFLYRGDIYLDDHQGRVYKNPNV